MAGRKKTTTKVTNANGGMHDTKAWNKVKAMIEGNDYKEAHLYHLVFYPLSKDKPPSLKDYQSARKELCRKLKRAGILHKWRACLEYDDEKQEGKGLHFHIFLMLENKSERLPSQFISPKEDGWFRGMLSKKGVAVYIASPRSAIHKTAEGKQKPYATLPKSNPEKIADCIEWISYLVKARSKSPNHKTTYFSSRDNQL